MGDVNKLLADVGGRAMVRAAVEAALGADVAPVIVVTGHEGDRVAGALAGLDVEIVPNPDYAEGLSTSLRAGLAALPDETAGAMILLADMPGVGAALVDRLATVFRSADAPTVVVPTHGGRRGNPVVWPAPLFERLAAIGGDKGGRDLLEGADVPVRTVAGGPAVLADIDTGEDLAAYDDTSR